MKLLRFIYFTIWKRHVARYIGIVYNELAQVKSIIEFIALLTAFLYVRGYKPSTATLTLISLGLFAGAVLTGYILYRAQVPHENSRIANELNPEFNEILEWVRQQKTSRRPTMPATVILPKTDRQRAQDQAEARARQQGIDGIPIDDYL